MAVYPIANTNADGTIKLGEPQYWNKNVTDVSVMRGFLRPQKIQDRDPRNVDVRNYLEPICTDVINQYAEKGYEIKQNPGW